jgi:hypothetical protein
LSVTSIYSAIYGVCGSFLVALAGHKPFRGGIDIGMGGCWVPHHYRLGLVIKHHVGGNI